MARSRPAPLALSWASLGLAFVVGACAPEGECQSYGDCPLGEFCQAGTCVSDNLPDAGPIARRDGGTLPVRDAGPGDDGGPAGDGEAQVRTTFDVPWIQWDPRTPGRILVAEQQVAGATLATDRVLALDTAQRSIGQAAVYDLTTMPSGACQLDSIVFDVAPDETWFNCDRGDGVRIVFDDEVADPANTDAQSAHVVHRVPGINNDFARALVAARGGALRSWQLRPSDALNQPREEDAFTTPVSGVTAIFDVQPQGVPGTHVLVHDAASSRLVPLSRLQGSEQWEATNALAPLTLPEATHVAWVIGPIAANGNAQNANQANVMTLEPATGLARFWNYETAQEILPQTTFEQSGFYRADKPDASERLLFAPAPSGSYVFYTRPAADKIYRIPLTPGGDTRVRQRLLDDTTREISSLLAVDDETVWVSYSNENLIERLVIDARP